MSRLLRLLLLALAAFAAVARANDDVDVEVEEDARVVEDAPDAAATKDEHVSEQAIFEEIMAGDYIRKHPNLVSYIMFPLTTNRTEFVAGERVDVLVGLENKNKASAVELKGIQASIRMPQQWDFHIQNFTGVAATEKIPAGAEAAILYTFVPHESFDSRDYGLTVLIDYEMDGERFRADVFNGTFTIFEQEQMVDIQTILMLLLTIGSGVAIGVGLQNALSTKTAKKKLKTAATNPVERGTVKKADPSWLEGTSAGKKK